MASTFAYSRGVAREAWRRFIDDDHFVYAGHMAFTLLLSFGPFIVCALLMVQHFDPEAVDHMIQMIDEVEGRIIPTPMADVLKGVIVSVAPGVGMADLCGPEILSSKLADVLNNVPGASPPPCSNEEMVAAVQFLANIPAAADVATIVGAEVSARAAEHADDGFGSHPLLEFLREGGVVVMVTVMVGLYAASSAFEAARNGFNEAYDVRDRRNFLWRRFQSHLLALVLIGLFVMVSLLFVFVTFRLGAELRSLGVDPARAMAEQLGQEIHDEHWKIAGLSLAALCGAILFVLLLLGIHLTLPRGFVKGWSLYVWAQDEIEDRRAVRVPVRPGVLISAAMWLLFAVAFSYLLSSMVSFDENHGVLAGVVATLLFFYLSAVMIFLGAQINIAIATIGPDGRPQWPHPQIQRPAGFDERTVEAYRVLTETRPDDGAISRFWHYLCGGGVCDDGT